MGRFPENVDHAEIVWHALANDGGAESVVAGAVGLLTLWPKERRTPMYDGSMDVLKFSISTRMRMLSRVNS